MTRKSLFSLLLSAVLLFGLAACSPASPDTSAPAESRDDASSAETESPASSAETTDPAPSVPDSPPADLCHRQDDCHGENDQKQRQLLRDARVQGGKLRRKG